MSGYVFVVSLTQYTKQTVKRKYSQYFPDKSFANNLYVEYKFLYQLFFILLFSVNRNATLNCTDILHRTPQDLVRCITNQTGYNKAMRPTSSPGRRGTNR